jgi:hypothetical protein
MNSANSQREYRVTQKETVEENLHDKMSTDGFAR